MDSEKKEAAWDNIFPVQKQTRLLSAAECQDLLQAILKDIGDECDSGLVKSMKIEFLTPEQSNSCDYAFSAPLGVGTHIDFAMAELAMNKYEAKPIINMVQVRLKNELQNMIDLLEHELEKLS